MPWVSKGRRLGGMRTERLDLHPGVTAAQLTVRCQGDRPGGLGDGLPLAPSLLDRSEHGSLSGGLGLQGTPDPRQPPVPFSRLLVASGTAFMVGPNCIHMSIAFRSAHEPQLLRHMRWRPGRLTFVGAAAQPQLTVTATLQLGALDPAERGQRSMPDSAGLRAGLRRLRADRVGRIGVTVPFPVGGNHAGPLLPLQPTDRLIRDRAKGLACPRRLRRSRVLPQATGPVIHHLGELTQIAVQIGGTGARHPVDPGTGKLGLDAIEHPADTRIQYPGNVTRPGHTPAGHRFPQDPAAVEPGGFSFPQRPPQPGARRIVQSLTGQTNRQAAAEGLPEPCGLGAAGQVVPDAAENSQVVGAGQFAVQGFRCGEFTAVTGQDTSKDSHRVDRGRLLVIGGLVCRQGGVLTVQTASAAEFGGRAAARADVSGLRVAGDAVGMVGVPAPAHRDVQSLPVTQPVNQDMRGASGPAERGVLSGRIAERSVLGQVTARNLERR